MRDICAGVGSAHRRGVFHRDLKPDNVIVLSPNEDREGESVKVVDFGIAKLRDPAGAPTLTETGALVGTPHYMSPEQCRGEPLDARSDVYSLGAMLYEMLAGTPPFTAETATGVMAKHLFDPPPPLPPKLEVATAVEEVIMRALAKDPDSRPADATTLARELREAERRAREEELRRRAEEERQRAESERQRAEAEAARLAEEEAARRREEEQRARAEEQHRRQAAAQQAAAQAAEEQRLREEAERRRREAERKRLEAEEAERRRAEASARARRAAEEAERAGREVAEPPPQTATAPPADAPLPPPPGEVRWRFILIAFSAVIIVTAVAATLLYRSRLARGVATGPPPVVTPDPGTVAASPPPAENTPPEGMVYVPGGTFSMGRDDGDEFERPAHNVAVKPFFIDTYEVTCGDYEKFVRETGHHQPPGWKNGACPQGWARRPITGVTWDDAGAYCQYATGKRLPTEEEWEFAARGNDGRLYPWGKEPGAEMANVGGRAKGLADVGTFKGASPFGAFDMVGNAWEWTASPLVAYPGGSIRRLPPGDVRVIRGGSYVEDVEATTTYRGYGRTVGGTYDKTGFRCAKDAGGPAAPPR